MLHSHDHYTYTYTRINIFNTIRTSGHSSLEKYTSQFIERVVCERELETEQNCNLLTPTLMAITAFLSRSPGLLNRQPGGPASLGHGPHSSIFSPTDLNCNCSIGGLRAPSAGYWFSLPHLFPNWLNFLCTELYNNLTSTLLPASQFSTQFNTSTVKVISWYSSTGCTCYLHRCISYFDSLAGLEVNIQHEAKTNSDILCKTKNKNAKKLADY